MLAWPCQGMLLMRWRWGVSSQIWSRASLISWTVWGVIWCFSCHRKSNESKSKKKSDLIWIWLNSVSVFQTGIKLCFSYDRWLCSLFGLGFLEQEKESLGLQRSHYRTFKTQNIDGIHKDDIHTHKYISSGQEKHSICHKIPIQIDSVSLYVQLLLCCLMKSMNKGKESAKFHNNI